MRPGLGTYVAVRADHEDEAVAEAAVNAAFEAIARVQRLMSVYEPDSDIARLNRLPPGERLQVDPWTWALLATALEVSEASGGLFDCSVAPQLVAWGLLPPEVLGPTANGPAGPGRTTLPTALCLHEGHQLSVRAPLRVDLGGIAKGEAVDRAVAAMQAAGARGGLVNAGGDLRVFGPTEEAIYLRDPGDPQRLRHAGVLQDGALATSATYHSRREHDGAEVSALVDPHSGQALRTRRSFTVVAPRCAIADALTKVLALSQDAHHPCMARFGAQALILDPAAPAPAP
jgi:thiamine biosynthesis lipoprotein